MNNFFDALNSATKYPSISTYHMIDPDTGILRDPAVPFTGNVVLTEKIDGVSSRIVFLRNGDWFIGSREELLYARDDRIISPAHGIVPALLPHALAIGAQLVMPDGFARVVFLEVFGHRIGPAARQYTRTAGVTGYRLFDLATIPEEVLSWPLEKIAGWRDRGGQVWATESGLHNLASFSGLTLTPRLGTVAAEKLPVTIEETHEFLREHLTGTRAALDDSAEGGPEGIVLRTENRSIIAKAKIRDYMRTFTLRAARGAQQKGKRATDQHEDR